MLCRTRDLTAKVYPGEDWAIGLYKKSSAASPKVPMRKTELAQDGYPRNLSQPEKDEKDRRGQYVLSPG